jgi:hypothetical protein
MTALNRVRWSNRISLSATDSLVSTRSGMYYGQVKHKGTYSGKQMAHVLFDGNRSYTRVPYEEMTFVGPTS